MEQRTRILLLTHGGWGMSLLKGVRMILGSVDFVEEVALQPEMTMPEYLEKVTRIVQNLPKNSLILTDVFGGTTTNIGAKLGKEYRIKVYSGLNAPLLLEACSEIMFSDELDEKAVLEVGKNSIKDVIEEVLESMKKEKQ